MKLKLKILHLEDSPTDRELISQLLAGEGLTCEFSYCDDRGKFLRSLESKDFDLILADCTLPDFSGFNALELARERVPEIPFIFVSGSIGEDSAIESLRRGATDYVLKDKLSRLVPAVQRAIAEAEGRVKSMEMEQRLLQAQRLEAVGTLAGGVAHDFNNILTIIKGHASLLLIEAGHPNRVHEIAATIDRASRRGSELVSQLLAFARKSDGSFTATAINQRVREITSMLREAMPRNVVFELQLDEKLPEIHADPGQVERVIINLATNARDAMPDGGKITLATSRVRYNEIACPTTEGVFEYLCLRVTDTGAGMDEATRQHIFEPFFTTKPKGQGTGLGMPVVYGLMQSHHGIIDVQSELGRGTTISLYFPIPKGGVSHLVAAPPVSESTVTGTETVLIVDDEPDVSYFVEMILGMRGYKVLLAHDAEQALEIIRNTPGNIQLLFSDIGLPKLDGFGLCVEARKLKPGLKTMLSSGYVDGALKTRISELAIDGFISKPYEMSTLLQNVRTILDKKD
jgi:two-component system, cell cycle sensor histidine kinase and response regulator CckA